MDSMLPVLKHQRHLTRFKDTDSADSMVDNIIAHAEDMIVREGSINPAGFILTKEEVLILPFNFQTPEDKDTASTALEVLANQLDTVGVAFVAESWLGSYSKKEQVPTSVKDDPNRKEVIIATASWAGSNTAMRVSFITRDENEEIVGLVRDDNYMNECDEIAGRFMVQWDNSDDNTTDGIFGLER